MGQSVKTQYVEVELISEQTAAVPGQPLSVGLSIKHAPHWHTYWQNPGDSGYPTSITWNLPEGYSASAFQWPTPSRLPTGPLINYGYEGDILLPLTIQVPANAATSGTITLSGKAEWLVCKDVCIPEDGVVNLTLPLAAQATPGAQAARFEQARQQLPGDASAWTATLHATAKNPEAWLHLKAPAGTAALTALDAFPVPEQITDPATQQVYRVDDGYAIKLKLLDDAELPAQLPLVLAATSALASDGKLSGLTTATVTSSAYTLATSAAPLPSRSGPNGVLATSNPLSSPAASSAGPSGSVLSALLLAFVGGLILNLMPCVFPVLSIKLLSFAQHSGGGHGGSLRQHGVFYAIGVVASFLLLAGLLIALKGAGSAVGWGFQLQNPGLIWLLAALFFVIGLNLMGAFEFGQFVPSSLLSARAKNPGVDAFFTGVLAVIAASPCTAPFMGAALGFALTQSAWVALAVFAALGVGMALPFVLLSLFPAWLRVLPKPGAWMNTFKQVLAFPMFITVVWLIWVLSQQAGVDGAALALLGLVGLAFAAWLFGSQRRLARVIGAVVAALALLTVWPSAVATENLPTQQSGNAQWLRWDPAEIARLNAEGKPVFVDFTAAWCVSCQANKRLVLSRAEVEQAFAAKNVTLMRADWTKRDAQITTALQSMGRSGVPVYVLHAPGKSPQLLPELLTTGIVKDALAGL